MKSEPEFMTPEEVAEKLRVTIQTVQRWCREEGLGTRYGHQYRITRGQLDEWARGREQVTA